MKKFFLLLCCSIFAVGGYSQALNYINSAASKNRATKIQVGVTDVKIYWSAPGVRGREGNIWGTPVAHYGFQNLGFGTSTSAPWRAGANENTTIYFSTDVMIEGKALPAGKYGFFVALEEESCTLIFSKKHDAWGSYFYDEKFDALRVDVTQKKDQPFVEWLDYGFSNHGTNSVTVELAWEKWRIPFEVSVNLNETVIASLRNELSGEPGFYDENWTTAANYCLRNDVNLEEGLSWIENAIGPPFGQPNFNGMQIKAGILTKLGREKEADEVMQQAMPIATVFELHGYGRQLIAQGKPDKALDIFKENFKRNGDTWPTHVGLTRGYSAAGNIKKSLEHARIALKQAPDELNRSNLENIIKTLEKGEAFEQ